MFMRRLHLTTGLILATYVFLHLLNIAVGLFSVTAMEAVCEVHNWIWVSEVGSAVLLATLLTHFGFALWALFRRSTLRMPAWEATQLWLGLSIPPLMAFHVAGTIGMYKAIGYESTFESVILYYWNGGAWGMTRHLSGLVVAWLHMCVGLHFWLRLKRWYVKAAPVLLIVASLIPVLALLGFNQAGQTFSRLAVEKAAAAEKTDYGYNQGYGSTYGQSGDGADYRYNEQDTAAAPAAEPAAKAPRATPAGMSNVILSTYWGLLGIVLMARLARRLYRTRKGRFQITLPDRKPISAPVGVTLLDALRQAAIPHAAVCGGRGRCSTCRVRVDDQSLKSLPPAAGQELAALKRISAAAAEASGIGFSAFPRHDAPIRGRDETIPIYAVETPAQLALT